MATVFAAYAVLGATVLVLALAAGAIRKCVWLSEPVLALAAGIAVGPVGFGWFEPAQWGDQELILEELARLTLAVSLMGVALRLPDEWVRHNWRPLLVLLLLGMPMMWFLASACGLLLLGLPVLPALLLGAIVTPTDPVAASVIVTGDLAEQHIDADTRHLISAESGANDGLAYLLLMLPALLLTQPPGAALQQWLTTVLLLEVLLPIVGGAAFGWLLGKLLVRVHAWQHAERSSLLAVTVAASLTILGVARLLHVDGILAVFAAGLAFNWVVREDAGHDEMQHRQIQEVLKRFFEVPVFLFFGMVLPWHEWMQAGWLLWAFAAAVLLLRRLPVLLLLRPVLRPVQSRRDALFVGWFGPVAVAAMVYAAWAEVWQGHRQLWVAASLVIFTSIVVHGVSATPLTRWYGRTRAAG